MSITKFNDQPPLFRWSQLWEPAIVNPANLKSYTLPIFNLRDPYAQVFHLSWVGYFVAFLSWFAFPPLIPQAIKSDLRLNEAQLGNSNVVALAATLIIRAGVGPLVDHYGPRKVMAGLLILGSIPSGLAGTAHSAETLYVLRFFIGILGATFVPCQAWSSAFFDKNCVGIANATVGGWGNMGGGATFIIMTSLFQSLTTSLGLSAHVAWRAAFAIVPVPILLFVAIMVLIFGRDHPAGKWSERHRHLDTTNTAKQDQMTLADNSRTTLEEKGSSDKDASVTVTAIGVVEEGGRMPPAQSTVDVAVNESLTLRMMIRIFASPVTWLPALSYLTTLGTELALNSKMAGILFSIYSKGQPDFTQTTAGYYASVFGFLNIIARPFGGYIGDVMYRSFGTKGKKLWMLFCASVMGATLLAGGLYLQKMGMDGDAKLPILIGVFSITAAFAESGNGANFALVPHCNPSNNGFMSGLVGSCGNLGGIIFTLIFRFETNAGKAFWIMGVISIAINLLLFLIPVPSL